MDKRCGTCKFDPVGVGYYPCCDCKGDFDHWQPVEVCEMVNHPAHYNQGKYECIDVMVELFGKEATQHFCLLNAFKYIWRTNYKNGVEDVKKAWWYIDKYLELEGEESGKNN
jgi:hypothetical protein